MAKGKKNSKVDEYLIKAERWQKEFKKLRTIILSCGLDEDLKWYKPCYSYQGKNVLILQGFNEECRIMFFKGALMKDPKKILGSQGENTQAARVIRFRSVEEITKLESTLKSYINNAIDVEASGEEIKLKKTSEYKMPEEFKKRLDKNAKLKKAFEALTPGRQRGYLLHFSGAKQSATRETRIDKCVDKILRGKGLND